MATKTSVPVMMSDAQKDFTGEYAAAHDMSVSEVARLAIAAYTGYDLDAEPKTQRRTKYANATERANATKERAKRKRDLQRDLTAAIERGDRMEDIRALAASIKNPDLQVIIEDDSTNDPE